MKQGIKEFLQDKIDLLTGREDRMRERYKAVFADGEHKALIGKAKQTNRMFLLAAAAMLIAASALWVSEALGAADAALDLERDGPGGKTRTVTADVRADYLGETFDERATIRILPKEPSRAEGESLLSELKGRLPAMILADNTAMDAVVTDLSLPASDPVTGADLTWSSSDERIISDKGRVNLIGAEEGTLVTLTAFLRLGEASDTLTLALKTGSPRAGYDFAAAIEQRVSEAVRRIGTDDSGEAAVLPAEAEGGLRLDWSAPAAKGHLPEILIAVAAAALAFRYRYRAVDKRIAEARAQVERDFPDFIGKLGLLLEAGLVITSAMERIIDDYLANMRAQGKRQLYEELVSMRERMRAAGTSLVYEFADIARRNGLREVMRFSSILADNIDKGSALADKLETESEMLWDSRKRRAEKAGRIAETKLIFPMVLQILVVIAVTVMPAAFEMQ
ncbi:MAG: type II secretion system F family protein [Clostridiales Family XIII bacterium]|jgi:Flp pilus assembly protein TadB|nr:type II secretion system F family protein [Clostridiales Family XIII bacterium]